MPDTTDGRNGGALRTVWEILLKMEKFKCQAGEKDQGAIALVLDLAKAFERVSLPVAWIWSDALRFSQEVFAGAMRALRAPEAGAVRRMCGRSRSGP